jgi:oligoendopeptidase F
MKDIDPYSSAMKTAILRKFSVEMEISQDEVEALFDSYMNSPGMVKLGALIKKRLGRDLKPYDIWYNGFKSQNTIPEAQLTLKTSALYPDPAAFRAGMPTMLGKLGWNPVRAKYLADKIVVDPARGSGHAWGAAMKGSVAHLRTRISDKGMDYKGYNIAVHEFGHTIEQTISLYDVDNYMMSGVPNTAITEALAFVFQSRNLMLLGIKDTNPDAEKMETLDAAWSLMEIMGVGMVDMKVWKWLYANPEATPAQLKEAIKTIAVDTWNKYFAPVIGIKDSPILAIYSHMVDSPLYLANYSYGHIVQFQLEAFLKGKNLANEIDRIYKQGRLTPQQWMMGAVGSKISTQPILNALDKVLQ